MDGIGLVTTSSPTAPRTGLPRASHESRATPRHGADSSPGHTGMIGEPPAKALTTSVPPDVELTRTRRPT